MSDTERARRTKKLIESLQAFRLLCKQLDHHAGELEQTYSEELRAEGADRVSEKILGEAAKLDEPATASAPSGIQRSEGDF